MSDKTNSELEKNDTVDGQEHAASANKIDGRESGLSIASFICSFFIGLVGIILGIIALIQSKKDGRKHNFAIAGIAVGFVQIIFCLMAIFLFILNIVSFNNYVSQNGEHVITATTDDSSNITSPLDNYPTKTIIVDNYDYEIYITDKLDEDINDGWVKLTGNILVYSTKANTVVESDDVITITYQSTGFSQQSENYYILSQATDVVGTKIIINLDDGNFYEIGNVSMMGDLYYYDGYFIFRSADHNEGVARGVGGGESYSISAIDLSSGVTKVILKSTALIDYSISSIYSGSGKLYYEATNYNSTSYPYTYEDTRGEITLSDVL